MEALFRSTLLNAILLASMLTFSHGIMKWVALRAKGSFYDLVVNNWLPLGSAITIYVVLFFYYTQILRKAPLSMLYPVYGGLSILFVFLLGIWFFGESASVPKIFGCALIMCGIFLVTK